VINGNVYDENHFEDDEVFENGSIYGCDSVLHVQLEFYEEILLEVKDTLAIGDSLIVNGQKYHAGYPVGIEIIQNGSSKGCDSTIVVDLYFQTNALTAKVLSIPPLCFGDSTGLVTIESISGGYDSIRLSLDGRPPLLVTDFPFSIQGLSAGTHSLWLVDAASLSDTLWIDIHLAAAQVLELDAGPDQEVNPGEDAQLNAQASFPVYSWLWSPVDFLSCTDCPDPVVIQPQHDILYTLLTEDLNGCQVSDDVLIQLSDDVKLYFPTIFSPNGDGINDFAMLSTNQELLVKSLSIFDRWGNLVSQQTDFSANDPSHGWDGTFNGKDMGPGVYVWLAEIEVESGVIKLYSGDVTLIR
jgi:gliding motility-associated-like protein